jgi:hypothetical protein
MSKPKPGRTPVIFATMVWMVINAIFFALEITVLNDAADLNNSIILVLMVLSIAGLASMKRAGAFFATFSLSYAFSFNAFNVIYFPEARFLNGVSAVINAVAIVSMYRVLSGF